MVDNPLWWFATAAAVIAGALAVHIAVFRVVRRFVRGSRVTSEMLESGRGPGRLLVVTIAASATIPGAPFSAGVRGSVQHGLALVLIGGVAWLAIRVGNVLMDAAARRHVVEVADNLKARRVRTQLQVLRRLMVVAVSVLAGAAMLTTFAEARALGASILASAGIVGLVAGVAARPMLGNLIAGIQIAFTEPIKLDDVVVVEGEWGRVEEITLTYVVVRIWDERRLVLPVIYFVENAFQNWTRTSSELLGTIFLYVDHRVPVDEVRKQLDRIVADSELWDGRVSLVQITDATEVTVSLRALVSARNSGDLWDLRCAVREGLVTFLQQNYPESLPRFRAELASNGEIVSSAP